MAELTQSQVTVCTNSPTESREELLNLIDLARDVSRPESLGNEDIYIADDDVQEYNIAYADGDLEQSMGEIDRTMIKSNTIDESTFHVHSNIAQENLESVVETHRKMIASADEVNVNYIGVAFTIEEPIDAITTELEFVELTEDAPDLEVLNFIIDGLDITIANYPVESTISVVETDIGSIEGPKLEKRVDETVEKASSRVNEMIS